MHGAPENAPLLDTVLAALEEHQADEVVVIELSGKSTIGDHMVVASGRSHRHVATLAEAVRDALKATRVVIPRTEGLEHADWVLIDGGDVIVHLFRPEVRAFYGIEKMWGVDLPDGARDA